MNPEAALDVALRCDQEQLRIRQLLHTQPEPPENRRQAIYHACNVLEDRNQRALERWFYLRLLAGFPTPTPPQTHEPEQLPLDAARTAAGSAYDEKFEW